MVNAYPQAIEKNRSDFAEVATSPYVKDYSIDRKQRLVALLPEDARILKFHQSLCPGCVDEEKFDMMKIDSVTFARHNKVWIMKQCAEHGVYKELSWGDYEMYKKAERFQDPGIKILNPHIDKSQFEIDCPTDCGLCVEHESHTGLGNIVVTNRCDLTCWYCFFYAKEGEPIYEPTMDQIKFMLKRMKNEKPVGANSVQYTGGEPTLREDLPEIVKAAKDLGYSHVQLNTNGINLCRDPQLSVNLRTAGVSNLYMSFDGMTPETNPKNYWEAQQAIDNCAKAGIGVVLVPTVIGGINDHELGDIIRFGIGNIGKVRSVNFQPVSLVGRMPDALRKKQRITIPGAIKRIEAQTDGQIGREHWFPVPCAKQITDFIESVKQEPKYRLSIHFQCGMATYIFKDGNRIVPLPEFFDVEGFFDYLGQLTRDIEAAKFRKLRTTLSLAKLMLNIRKYVDEDKKPKNLKFVRMLAGAVGGSNYHGLAEFHMNSLFLGMMHFQDPFNWDIDRIHKCDIHYATPDGRVLPFCTFNVIPELYRDRIQRKFSIPAVEWEKRTGKKLNEDKHHRKFSKEEIQSIVGNFNQYRRSMTKVVPESDWGEEAYEPMPAATSGGFVPLQMLGAPQPAHKKATMENPAGGGCSSGCGC
ncbi:MAG: radical SAM protein [Candidatus Aenigmarchaeota archaeon]|nr:radical SAM protein [Candidatus Aenigmarchaeota archaeon]